MRHLSEEELIDVAEGTRPESAWPHLSSCDSCRAQIADLRAMMSAAGDVTVPEPSPLFWDRFSARVRDQVAAIGDESAPPALLPAWTSGWLSWRFGAAAAALAAIVVAAAGTLQGPASTSRSDADAPAIVETAQTDDLAPLGEDPSLSFIADLAADLDWDAAVEAGLAGAAGTVDHALFTMSPDERLELQRILEQEMSGLSGRGVS
jgi:hypothetical protein